MAVRKRTSGDAEAAGPTSPPPAALDTERIFAATLALIDEHGLAAFNLRLLATSLGVYPTAIYWHVPSRTDLIAGAVALALRDVAASVARGDWRARLRTIFIRFRAALQRHPALAPLVAAELGSSTAAELALVDRIVAALEEGGFAGAGLVDAYNVVVAAMCGFATLELASPPSGDAASWERDARERLSNASGSDYPALSRHLGELRDNAFIVRWTGGADAPLDSGFNAWVDVVITGLERRALTPASRRSARAGTAGRRKNG